MKFRWWMTSPIGAIYALRWNYRWSGVWIYLRANHRRPCRGGPGWWLVIRYPSFVVAQQLALAEGVTA